MRGLSISSRSCQPGASRVGRDAQQQPSVVQRPCHNSQRREVFSDAPDPWPVGSSVHPTSRREAGYEGKKPAGCHPSVPCGGPLLRARWARRESKACVHDAPSPATPQLLLFYNLLSSGSYYYSRLGQQLKHYLAPFADDPLSASSLLCPCSCRMGSSFSPTPAPAAPSPLNPGWSPATNQNNSNQQASVARSTSAGSYSNSEESSEGARARRSGGAAGEWTGGSSGVLDGLARGEIGSAYGASCLLSCLPSGRVSSTAGS